MPSRTIARISLAVLGFRQLFTCASPLDDELSLFQQRLRLKSPAQPIEGKAAAVKEELAGVRDLVLQHVPFNFGHTVESVAMFGSGMISQLKMFAYLESLGGFAGVTRQASWAEVGLLGRSNGEVWGHLNPDLQVISNVTGCPMYYTPPKHWPQQLAARYFGDKTVFGILRDPYERLVAFFRGGMNGYGSAPEYEQYKQSCDVNSAVKQMMKDYKASNNPFKGDCTFLPQAEYFDGPHGITLPVNNREFPESMNNVFRQHGYDMNIRTEDIMHVRDCDHVWAGDLDEETRSLVREVYERDFTLLCEHFGYCDVEESCCIYQVPLMCPATVMEQGYHGQHLSSLDGDEWERPRMRQPWQSAPGSSSGRASDAQEDAPAVNKLLGPDVWRFVSNSTQAQGLLKAAAAIGSEPTAHGGNHTLLDSFILAIGAT